VSVTAAKGFTAAGVQAGIKVSGRRDLALVVNTGPDKVCAAVYTSNRFQAAPVLWSKGVTAGGFLDAVVLNSGGANACTGPDGLADSRTTAALVAAAIGSAAGRVAVCSTGLIGVRLPMDAVAHGVTCASAALSADGGADAALAIMTTDTVPKTAAASGPGWTVGGMAKGAGMLAPALATMLVVITTDAVLTSAEADAALRAATALTFDRADSDGCMSTNDTVILMASGAGGAHPEADEFTAALTSVCGDLAHQLLADSEGSSHDIAVNVVNAASEADALDVARCIARSNLFKCAVFGNDPNWGRVLASAGTSSAAFDPDAVSVSFNGVQVFRSGALGEDRSLVDLTGSRDVEVVVDLAAGDASATIWTNDLTYDYVKENAEYSS
jgi:glutamate N-acetyltransferase / amino-acid N-acetyltransferase